MLSRVYNRLFRQHHFNLKLIAAVHANDKDKVVKYLKCGADAKTKMAYGTTMLMKACDDGNNAIAKLLILEGADVNAKDPRLDGFTALSYACWHKDVSTNYANPDYYATVQVLIEGGADVNTKDSRGYTPLHNACLHNRTDIINLLLQHGADPFNKKIIEDSRISDTIQKILKEQREKTIFKKLFIIPVSADLNQAFRFFTNENQSTSQTNKNHTEAELAFPKP